MDKLRALQYFVATAEERSFSGAARRLEVSVPAVAKLVTALERSLGIRLFERAANGVSLTAGGASYLEACAPALARLVEADEITRASTQRSPGKVVVGVQHVIARGCLSEALPRFHARHPEIQIDLRDFTRLTEEQTSGVDVFLVMGWPKVADLIHRRVAAGRFVVAASPAYWATHGLPRHPRELEQHVCLPIRAVDGTVMDLWTFSRGTESVSVAVKSWLTISNAHRDTALELALAGEGVVRLLDWTDRDRFESGALVRALADWQSPEAPPVNLLYRASVRRIPRVRLFIDFVVERFREIEVERGQQVVASEAPSWLWRRLGRASAVVNRRL
jgi:LysR family transcriptional regulator, regulator for bpeEF and oprC